MRIGVDLSPLQNAHRMRGIGYTLINFINNLSAEERANHSFVFYVLPKDEALFKDPFELLDLDGITFITRGIAPRRRIGRTLPGKLNILTRIANKLITYYNFYLGIPRITDTSELDVFLQADQSEPLPKTTSVKRVLIIYDLIPYILEADYWWTYRSARMHGCSRKGSVRWQLLRQLLTRKVTANTRRADQLIAISEKTKHDFVELLGVPADKITVSLLGVTQPEGTIKTPKKLHHYINTNWGYIKRDLALDLTKTKYLLYVGGADRRRKLEDLVTAFNHLRAQGQDVKLVLAGDIMLGPKAITTEPITDALLASSYLDDIIFMGFIDDETRDWLYAHAQAFVYPSRYEGFGLPVLEAMIHNCPVVAYDNAAVVEVAGSAALYANTEAELTSRLKELLSYDKARLDGLRKAGHKRASSFTWTKTAADFMSTITSKK